MADILLDNEAAPSTPASAKSIIYCDNTSAKQMQMDSSGVAHGQLSRNASITSQGLTANTDTYVTASNLIVPSCGIQVGQHYRWWMQASKTGAGVGTPIYSFRLGNSISTSDTALLQLTGVAQTGVIDTALFILSLMVQVVGSSTGAVVGQVAIVNTKGVAVGFGSTVVGSASSLNLAGAGGLSMGISINDGASAAWTVSVISELIG